MNAMTLQWTECQKLSEEAKTHVEILGDLLREMDLEKRMEMIIKTESLLKEENFEEQDLLLEQIREGLEEDLWKVRKMIFMVERAQYSKNSGQS